MSSQNYDLVLCCGVLMYAGRDHCRKGGAGYVFVALLIWLA